MPGRHSHRDASQMLRQVPTGPRQTLDEALFDQIDCHADHNGDRRGGMLERLSRRRTARPDGVRLALDQLGGEGGKPVGLVLSIAVFEEDVVPLYITKVAQPLLEGRETGEGTLLGVLC